MQTSPRNILAVEETKYLNTGNDGIGSCNSWDDTPCDALTLIKALTSYTKDSCPQIASSTYEMHCNVIILYIGYKLVSTAKPK